MSKASKVQVDQRVEEVLEYLLEHKTTQQIQKIFQQKYNLKYDMTLRYVNLARRKWIEKSIDNIEQKRLKAIKTLERLFRAAWDKGQIMVCLHIQREINTLNKLNDQELGDVKQGATLIKLIKNDK
jgi:hypothetical protein